MNKTFKIIWSILLIFAIIAILLGSFLLFAIMQLAFLLSFTVGLILMSLIWLLVKVMRIKPTKKSSTNSQEHLNSEEILSSVVNPQGKAPFTPQNYSPITDFTSDVPDFSIRSQQSNMEDQGEYESDRPSRWINEEPLEVGCDGKLPTTADTQIKKREPKYKIDKDGYMELE